MAPALTSENKEQLTYLDGFAVILLQEGSDGALDPILDAAYRALVADDLHLLQRIRSPNVLTSGEERMLVVLAQLADGVRRAGRCQRHVLVDVEPLTTRHAVRIRAAAAHATGAVDVTTIE